MTSGWGVLNRWRRTLKSLCFSLLFLFGFALCFGLGLPAGQGQWTKAVAQASNPSQLVQQGVDRYQSGDISGALQPWQTALVAYQQSQQMQNSAIVVENLARAYQQLGQTSQAIDYWAQGVELYRQLGDSQQVGRLLSEQAQSYMQLGQSRPAIELLCGTTVELANLADCRADSALGIAQTNQDQTGEAAALGSLGEVYRLKGDYPKAIEWLNQSLEIAKAINQPSYIAAALNGLGNANLSLALINYRLADSATQAGDISAADQSRQLGLDYDRQALTAFEAALTIAEQQGNPTNQLRSLIGTITPLSRTGSSPTLAVEAAIDLLEQLPDTQNKVYSAIELAKSVQFTSGSATSSNQCFGSADHSQTVTLLQSAIATATRINDPRSASFALGELGHVYECRSDYTQALELTDRAGWMAEQNLQSKDSLYQWEWQRGRILKAQGKPFEAIAAYEKAVATLESIRSDLLIASRDLQFDFRDTVDPLYRELVTLRLETEQQQDNVSNKSENIDATLNTLESLKLAELQNYFGDDCVIAAIAPERIDQSTTNSAIFNSIVLNQKTAILVSFPNGQQQLAWIDADRNTFRQEINDYRRSLERYFEDFDSQQAEKLYRWMIAPFVESLQAFQINTLVFVQDDILRTVPMTALYDPDRQQYLIEQYAIATTPSITLTDPQPLNRKDLEALAVGLTEETVVEGRRFVSLENVSTEINAIGTELPGSKTLLNQDFTRERLQEELQQTAYPILHIATHGEFGADPKNTFLVTGDSQKLTIPDLDALIRTARSSAEVELLALTACQTAIGDDRSALGLAGVAIQAGVKSALASLWYIEDAATAQIASQFYADLRQNPNLTKAQALQAAQIAVLRQGGEIAQPAYWAPFILIGNWL